MHLSKVEITNFRCFKNFTLSLTAGLNVVAGRNNTGKSNLLAAIRHALGPNASRGESLWLTRDDFYREAAGAAPATTLRVQLTFAKLTERQRAQFFEIVDFDLADIENSTAVVRFEASWPERRKSPSIQRWGGPDAAERSPIPAELLEALPVTFLPPLRDAEAALAPGQRSRLAALLRDLADRGASSEKEAVEAIFQEANERLVDRSLVKDLREALQGTTGAMAGSDYAESTIRAAGVDFDRILRTLKVEMAVGPIPDLSANGLGYNNLLYMAVVLEHLKSDAEDESPLLLVEEPEAHLHPQLVVLLARYLSMRVPGPTKPQTIVTTHSPVFATCVAPSQMRLMRTLPGTQGVQGISLADAGLEDTEERELGRLLDVTRASLYFAKGAIVVEGISEALLIPVLAARLNHDLAAMQVSVIPICGVAFKTLAKLLKDGVLGIPVVIVTDADPPVVRGHSWEADEPRREGANFAVSARVIKLRETFEAATSVRVVNSQVTLEYDLAEAGPTNADTMVAAWVACFDGQPGTFNAARLASAGPVEAARALCVWRGICRAEHSGSKAEFAQRLAEMLAIPPGTETSPVQFTVPNYLADAITSVAAAVLVAEAAPPEADAP